MCFSTAFRKAGRFLACDRGQGLVEYALVIALVAIVAIVALRLLGKKANNSLNNAAGSLS
jgi:pilus assembly protein Flp/PilA